MTCSLETIRDRAEWSFETPSFLVAFEPEPETVDPADCFQFDDDIEIARSGELHDWFCAVVTIYLKRGDRGDPIGRDVLGGCSYASFRDFTTGHRDRDPMNRNCSLMRAARGGVICHYFPDMVRAAAADARRNVAATPKLRAAGRALPA